LSALYIHSLLFALVAKRAVVKVSITFSGSVTSKVNAPYISHNRVPTRYEVSRTSSKYFLAAVLFCSALHRVGVSITMGSANGSAPLGAQLMSLVFGTSRNRT